LETSKKIAINNSVSIFGDKMSNLFNEIDDDLRQDRIKSLWASYKNSIFSAVIVISLVLIGSEAYQYLSKSKTEKSGLQFSKIIESIMDDEPALTSNFIDELLESGTSDYKTYALLLKADNFISQDKLTDARLVYTDLIKKAENSLIRDLAKLKLSYLNVDTEKFDQIEEGLSLILKDDNPLSLFANEVLAMSAYKNGLYERGIEHLNVILESKKTTNGMFDRAQMMLRVINSK
tara:strand:+ start:234 stop:935 length:702 start_codon:yes stop_codon:yes gene_type:complete